MKKQQLASISLFAVSLTPGFSPVSGGGQNRAVSTASRTEKLLKPFWVRLGLDTRLKPGVNE